MLLFYSSTIRDCFIILKDIQVSFAMIDGESWMMPKKRNVVPNVFSFLSYVYNAKNETDINNIYKWQIVAPHIKNKQCSASIQQQ